MKKKVICYMGYDITPLLMINQLVPFMRSMGLEPVIHLPQKYITDQLNILELSDLYYYENVFTHKIVFPFLNSLKHSTQQIYTIDQLQKIYGLEVVKVQDVEQDINKNLEYASALAADPEIIGGISVFCDRIFKKNLIGIFQSKGFFWNTHPGLLPHIRGLAAPFWSTMRDDKHYGPTLHHIIEGIDEGRVLSLKRLTLNKDRAYILNRIAIAKPAVDLVKKQIELEMAGQHDMGWEQDSSLSTYYKYPTQAQFAEFMAKGYKLFPGPAEMARLYFSFFKPDDINHARALKNIMLEAITAHEADKKRRAEALQQTTQAA